MHIRMRFQLFLLKYSSFHLFKPPQGRCPSATPATHRAEVSRFHQAHSRVVNASALSSISHTHDYFLFYGVFSFLLSPISCAMREKERKQCAYVCVGGYSL